MALLHRGLRRLWLKPHALPRAEAQPVFNPVRTSPWKCSQLGYLHHEFAETLIASSEHHASAPKTNTKPLTRTGAIITGFTAVSSTSDVAIAAYHSPTSMAALVLRFTPGQSRREVVARATTIAWRHLTQSLLVVDPSKLVHGVHPLNLPPLPHKVDHCGPWASYRSAALTGRHAADSAWGPNVAPSKPSVHRVGAVVDVSAPPTAPRRDASAHSAASPSPVSALDKAESVTSVLEAGTVQWAVAGAIAGTKQEADSAALARMIAKAAPDASRDRAHGDSALGAFTHTFVAGGGPVDAEVAAAGGRLLGVHGGLLKSITVAAVDADLLPGYRLWADGEAPDGVREGMTVRSACTAHPGVACACFLRFLEDDVPATHIVQPSFAVANGLM